MCIFSQRAEVCTHFNCFYVYFFLAMNQLRTALFPDMEEFSNMLDSHNSILRTLVEQNQSLLNQLDEFKAFISNGQIQVERHKRCKLVLTDNRIEESLSNLMLSDFMFPFHIRLEKEVELPVLKEKAFKLLVSLRDFEDNLVFLDEDSRFKIAVFTQEEKPIQLVKNISGKPIIRGTIEAEMQENGLISFVNVVVNEVSSHYHNDRLSLVVFNMTNEKVKPLIIKNIIVRARRALKLTNP